MAPMQLCSATKRGGLRLDVEVSLEIAAAFMKNFPVGAGTDASGDPIFGGGRVWQIANNNLVKWPRGR
jgi:hypothetical protein